MKQIVICSAGPWEAERERAEQLEARMGGYTFLFVSPADLRGPFKKARFNSRLEKAAARAILILVSPADYADKLQIPPKPVFPLPEGVDFEAFHGVTDRNLPFPDDLFNVKNPIIGHTGPVDGDMNLAIVAGAAEAHPEWAFVFAGPVLTDVSSLKPFPNIHLLGEKPSRHLPAYVSRFDVCINIAVNENASPKKLYEYLAAGKPVVSTPHPAQVLDYTEAVGLAGTPGEFITLCKKAIVERDAWKVRRRVEYGRAASWEARAAELERMIKELSL